MKYISRLTDKELKHKLKIFGAVEIKGPKWCGKTTTAKQFTKSFVNMDEVENQNAFSIAPTTIMSGKYPRLIDEWQDQPNTWTFARRIIDEKMTKGLFVFTGSATPGKSPTHSGAGRFSNVNMNTMSLLEMGISDGKVGLKELFENNTFESVKSALNYKKIVDLICKGGWPENINLSVENSMQIATEYINAISSKDIQKATGINHDPVKFKLFLHSLARNISTPIGVSKIIADISKSEQITISDKTIDSYYNAIRQIYLLNEIPAFSKNLRSKSKMRTTSIKHFADVSLAVASLNASKEMIYNDIKTTGLLFESLCIHDLEIYANYLNGKVYQYRDANGFEVDAIIKLQNGKWGAIEIKLGINEFDNAAKKLLSLKKDAINNGEQAPSFLMILTGTSGVSGTRSDGVHIVCLDNLGI